MQFKINKWISKWFENKEYLKNVHLFLSLSLCKNRPMTNMAIGAIYIGIVLCQAFQGEKFEYVVEYEYPAYNDR